MKGSGKCDRKTDFLRQLSFQLAQSYLSNRKLRAETKILAEKMGFFDTASNTINRTVQGIKRERCYRCGSILALHAWFAADVFARNTEKYQKTHIAWNAEQFVIVLHVCVFLCLKYNLRLLKFCCTSAKS